MSRAKWKGPFFDANLYKKLCPDRHRFPNVFWNTKIFARNCVIPKFLVGKRLWVHSGKTFKKINTFSQKVGFKFGEFCFTRKKN